jgi:hypothetical protein
LKERIISILSANQPATNLLLMLSYVTPTPKGAFV